MTRATRRILGRRLSFYMAALGLMYIGWCSAWDALVVPQYRATAEKVRVKYEIGYALGWLPAWARKP